MVKYTWYELFGASHDSFSREYTGLSNLFQEDLFDFYVVLVKVTLLLSPNVSSDILKSYKKISKSCYFKTDGAIIRNWRFKGR